MTYYPIDEDLARRAKEMNSHFDYKEGSATREYRQAVDQAAQLAEAQKRKVAPIHHDKIDQLLDSYAQRLAENINHGNAIACRVPSILVAGGSNFPVRKKEKQNRASAANLAEWKKIQSLLDKIRGTGMGGISADDPEVLAKLKVKLEEKEQLQETMKAVNAYYRKHKTLDGCPGLSFEEIEKLKASMARDWRENKKPYPTFLLTNNSAVIRQTRTRIEELTAQAEASYEGWAFDGGEVKMNREANRLQVFFDEKPDRDTCSAMRHGGFRWAPSVGAWQRQLNENAIRAAKNLDCLRPLSVEPPAPAPEPEQAEPVPASPPVASPAWTFYIIADLKTWADNAADRSPLERFPSYEEAKTRFQELRGLDYNSEAAEPQQDGLPPARLTLGVESTDGLSALDILHVRQGRNYLVDDFAREPATPKASELLKILEQVCREIGFDRIRPHEYVNDRLQAMPDMPFEEWDNPYFSSGTPGSIAARYCAFLDAYYSLPEEEPDNRGGKILQVVRFLQKEGKYGADQMSLSVAQMVSAKEGLSETVRIRADALQKELSDFDGPRKEKAVQKGRRKKSPER